MESRFAAPFPRIAGLSTCDHAQQVCSVVTADEDEEGVGLWLPGHRQCALNTFLWTPSYRCIRSSTVDLIGRCGLLLSLADDVVRLCSSDLRCFVEVSHCAVVMFFPLQANCCSIGGPQSKSVSVQHQVLWQPSGSCLMPVSSTLVKCRHESMIPTVKKYNCEACCSFLCPTSLTVGPDLITSDSQLPFRPREILKINFLSRGSSY